MLRVIGGTAKGVPLKTPDTKNTRPTLDRTKESLFNILMPYISGTLVLDLFSGSGSLGIEVLSRGAKEAVFVDQSKNCRDIIIENLRKTRMEERSKVMTLDVIKAIKTLSDQKLKFDIIFLDPPYNMNFIAKTIQNIDEFDIIAEEGILACEHHVDENAPERVGSLTKVRTKVYGETLYSFYLREI
ncbi:MAG: 16S rRNA (guanine(966)-N(2))-methyltransferase RsmD [Clostridiaceae bacterium]|jgi:16S rRNA (guanine(966)-N(2))-methyltransferase RsmD|nr:16S rRNA (guanine(966)-N(2))-methyltransferase RsmD [Clostridiaceae bacterium]